MEQLKIGLCDDQPIILQELQKLVSEYFEGTEITSEIVVFSEGEAMLARIDEVQIAFLDIEMPQMDGIELGRRIKEKNPECRIIMATGMRERFKEAFVIQAIRFVTKPFEKKEVWEALDAAIDSIQPAKWIEAFYNRTEYRVAERDIHYVMAFDSYVEIVTKTKTLRKKCSLESLEKVLDEHRFMRVNRTLIVNFNQVQEAENGAFLFAGEKLKVSRRKQKDFLEKYMEYDLRYRGRGD